MKAHRSNSRGKRSTMICLRL